jgi:hypothetical protein
MAASRDELRTEYEMIQGQYEQFDARALKIKSWSGPLIAAVMGYGWKEHSNGPILAAIVAALSLWFLEAVWKSFQYCYTDRIKLIEGWFRDGRPEDIAPFQVFSAWGEVWSRWFGHPKSWLPILRQPFVFVPYLPLLVFGLGFVMCGAWK